METKMTKRDRQIANELIDSCISESGHHVIGEGYNIGGEERLKQKREYKEKEIEIYRIIKRMHKK